MATTIQRAGPPRQASFRHVTSGTVVNTGCFHDITCLPGGEEADLEMWEAGFTNDEGCFHTRWEAARLLGVCGRLESESYFSGAANPTLEAGFREAWRKPGMGRR